MNRISISEFVFWSLCLVFTPVANAGPCQTICAPRLAVNHSGPVLHKTVGVGYSNVGYLQAYPVLLEVQRNETLYSSNQYLQNEALLKALELLQQRQSPPPATNANTGLDEATEKLLRGIPKLRASSSGDDVQSITNDSCISCHDGKRHPLDLRDLTKLAKNDRIAVLQEVAGKTMPPKGRGELSKEQIKTFTDWVINK